MLTVCVVAIKTPSSTARCYGGSYNHHGRLWPVELRRGGQTPAGFIQILAGELTRREPSATRRDLASSPLGSSLVVSFEPFE